MAEQRQKSLTILLHDGRKTRHTVELFPAEQWPERDGRPGMFRVRQNRKWYALPDKYSFYGPAAIGEGISGLIASVSGVVNRRPGSRSQIPPVGAAVRVAVPGRTYKQIGRVVSGSLIAEDWSFQVLVSFQDKNLFYQGRQLIPVDRLEENR